MSEMAKDLARLMAPPPEPKASPPPAVVWNSPPRQDVAPTLAPGRLLDLTVTHLQTPRSRAAELGGMLLWSIVLAMVLSMAWALIFQQGDWRVLAPTCFLALASSWAFLIPGKLWTPTPEESWVRRLTLMFLGLAVGLLAVWFEGYQLPLPWLSGRADALDPLPRGFGSEQRHPFFGALYPENHSLPVLACYLSYFGLMFLVQRWWRDVEEQRPQRFSVPALLATLFWAYALLFLLPTARERHIGFATMAMASVIIQVVSPWRAPAPERTKKLRLRYA
jgi:hypothetical protein